MIEGSKEDNKVPWRRSKLMIVGQGKAGKTATVRSLLGLSFEPEWVSTVGAELTRTNTRTRSTNGKSESLWQVSKSNAATFTLEAAVRFGGRRPKESLPKEEKIAIKKEARERKVALKDLFRENVTEDQVSSLPINKKEIKSQIERVGERDGTADIGMKKFAHHVIMNSDTDENAISFNIWDYGGQEVFYTLHHLFLTRYGVYMVVFDLREVETSVSEVIRYLTFWLNSVRMHASSAPVLIVGTHLDTLEEMSMEDIDDVLKEVLGQDYSNFPQVHVNEEEGLCFFPVDNKSGLGIERIRLALETVTVSQDYINTQVSFRWIRCLDTMLDNKEKSWFSLKETKSIAADYGILSAIEVSEMLSLFNELGVLVHLTATATLSDIVTTNPQWLIDKISKVILDRRFHLDTNKFRSVGLREDAERLYETAVASGDLLEYLWGRQHTPFFLDFMRRTFLLSDYRFNGKKRFLIPSMLDQAESPLTTKKMPRPKRKERQFSIDFPSDHLPSGVFERIVCLCVSNSSNVEKPFLPPRLWKTTAQVWFGKEDLDCLYILREPERLRISIWNAEAENKYLHIVTSILHKIQADIMGEKFTWELKEWSETKGSFQPYTLANKTRKETTNYQGLELEDFLSSLAQ